MSTPESHGTHHRDGLQHIVDVINELHHRNLDRARAEGEPSLDAYERALRLICEHEAAFQTMGSVDFIAGAILAQAEHDTRGEPGR
jgi:hypothetical protein